ncbi:MAG: Gldg family protein [Terrimicrobiaceae bacterium]
MSGIPRTGIRISIGLQVLAMLVLYAGANFLSFEYYSRADCSRSQKFALSAQTRRVIREFKEVKPVNVIVICSPTFLSPVTQILGDLRSLLAEIQFAGRERVVIEYIDPTRDLNRMRELQGKYKFNNADSLIILDCDGRTRFLNIGDMADFDMRPAAQGEAPRLLAFRGEQVLTGALISLLRPESQVVYFLQGHGEPALGASSPVAVLTDYVQKQNARVDALSLASSDAIPADAAALVVLAPKFDLDDRETAILSAWLKVRGRLLVLLDPNAKTPRLCSVLAANGIVPQDDRVLRTIKLPFTLGILREVTGEILPTTEFTRRLEGATILFPGATQSLKLEQVLAEKQKIRLRPLIQASEEFWGETNYAPNLPQGVHYDDGVDHGQPLPIAASADRDGVEDDRIEVQTSKLIVVGSSQFAFDASATPQGMDFILSSINSLLDRGKLLSGVTAKSVTHFALNLTDEQLGRIALFTMVVLPAFSGLIGLLVWWRRRK